MPKKIMKSKTRETNKKRASVSKQTMPASVASFNSKKQTPNLLSIAPELRHRIFEFALVENEPIEVHRMTRDAPPPRLPGQPALLATCRQIRSEAISIWYNENAFIFEACTFKLAGVMTFCKILRKYHKDPAVRLDCQICPGLRPFGNVDGEIDNLLEWLELFHAEPDIVPCPAQDTRPFFMASKIVASRLFGIVKNMQHQPWDTVEEVLYPFFQTIEYLSQLDCGQLAFMKEFHATSDDGQSSETAYTESDPDVEEMD